MALQIILTPYDYSLSLDRDTFLELFPESLIAQTLSLDPTATSIEIPNIDVTPGILQILEYVTVHHQVPKVIPDDSFIRASNYLNIDILTVLVDPLLPFYLQLYTEINLLDLNENVPKRHYTSLLDFGARTRASYLMWYLFRRVPKEKYPVEDIRYFLLACYVGGIGLVQHGLSRVNPYKAKMSIDDYYALIGNSDEFMNQLIRGVEHNQALCMAAYRGHTEVIQILLRDKRVTYEVGQDRIRSIYDWADLSNNLEVQYLIKMDPRADDNPNLLENQLNRPEVVRVSLLHSKVDPTRKSYITLVDAFIENYPQSLELLLNDYRVDPMAALDNIFNDDIKEDVVYSQDNYRGYATDHKERLDVIIANPRVDLNRLPDLFWWYVAKFYSEDLYPMLRSRLEPSVRAHVDKFVAENLD